VFFDLDETLLRHTLDGTSLVRRVYEENSGIFNGVDVRTFGRTLYEKGQALWGVMFDPTEPGEQALVNMFRDALIAMNLDPAHGRTLRDAFVGLVLTGTEPYPGAKDTLGRLRSEGITTGIITNGYCHLQDAKIARHGLADLVDFVLVSEAAGAHKPDPRIFQLALERAETAAEDAWHVGDHLVNDIAGAENAGLTGILFDPHGDRLPADAAALPEGGRMPTHTVADLVEVASLATNLRSGA
jgi:putative hydrolase of the HAD superfamily